jgi:hypothetical protein
MKKQINLLKRLGAPQQLINSFIEVCEINSQLPEDMRSDFPSLLEEQCRKFGFDDVLPDGWFFRPYKASGLGYRADVAATADQSEAPPTRCEISSNGSSRSSRTFALSQRASAATTPTISRQ